MKFSVVISQTSLVVISQTITVVFSQTSQAIFSQIFTFKKFFQCSAPEVSAPLLPAAHAADVTSARAAVRSAAPPSPNQPKAQLHPPPSGEGAYRGMGHLRQSGELPGCRCKQDYHPFLSDSPAHANDLFDVRQNRGICFAAAHSAVKALSPAPGGVPYRQGSFPAYRVHGCRPASHFGFLRRGCSSRSVPRSVVSPRRARMLPRGRGLIRKSGFRCDGPHAGAEAHFRPQMRTDPLWAHRPRPFWPGEYRPLKTVCVPASERSRRFHRPAGRSDCCPRPRWCRLSF